MNKKLVLLGILLLVGLTLSGCVAVGGYGYGYSFGYYSYPNSYGYYGYPYGYQQPRRDWDDHRGSWGGFRR
jgi:hypothetical protein